MTPEYVVIVVMVTILILGGFIRLEHRMTKLETILSIIAGKLGLCLPNSDKDSQ